MLVEVTNEARFLLPVIIAVLTANGIADKISPSLYVICAHTTTILLLFPKQHQMQMDLCLTSLPIYL